MYKLTNTDTIVRLSDNASIPMAEGNRDYREYLEWVAAGNTPGAADPQPNPRVSEIKSRLSQIDIESIRALRGVGLGRGRPGDNASLSALEDEAEILWAELATTPEFV